MKKLLLILAVVLNCALAVSSQTAQVATLSHDGAITTFYSANALKDAYAAAAEGDVITLSAGTFAAPANIEKNITVRGVGMMLDAMSTILNGDIKILTTDSETAYVTLEGIYHNGRLTLSNSKDAKIIKCWIEECIVYSSVGFQNKNLTIINCLFNRASTNGSSSYATLINSIIADCRLTDLSSGSFINCVLGGENIRHIYRASLRNCVICDTNTSPSTTGTFSQTTDVSHCCYIGRLTDPFKNSPSTTNVVNTSLTAEDVFKNMVTYELKDEYAGSWLGEDGTQVGAHGGSLPFDPTPTNPQITKFNVSSKTTADGMLSVDIEVKANN